MSAFLFAFAAVALTSLGSRDQLLVAHLAGRLGKTLGLLATGLLVSVLTAGLMAWAGSTISAMLPPAAKSMLVAIALVVAGVELAWPRQMRLAAEPTRSLGAIGLVLGGVILVVFALGLWRNRRQRRRAAATGATTPNVVQVDDDGDVIEQARIARDHEPEVDRADTVEERA